MKNVAKKDKSKVKLPNLRRAREKRELSQDQVAKKARVSYHHVSGAELGRAIAIDKATKIASALGLKLASLRA
jgi:transcriptional regulator with XRE-family HTH domain